MMISLDDESYPGLPMQTQTFYTIHANLTLPLKPFFCAVFLEFKLTSTSA